MRRWRHAISWDGYIDSEHMYPPNSAQEIYNTFRPHILLAEFGKGRDFQFTRYARRRPLRYHPWKRAR